MTEYNHTFQMELTITLTKKGSEDYINGFETVTYQHNVQCQTSSELPPNKNVLLELLCNELEKSNPTIFTFIGNGRVNAICWSQIRSVQYKYINHLNSELIIEAPHSEFKPMGHNDD